MTTKIMEKPTQPFFYISGRPYSFSDSALDCHVLESLTEERGDNIIQHLGKNMEIAFYNSSKNSEKILEKNKKKVKKDDQYFRLDPITIVTAKLDDCAKIKIDKAKEGTIYEGFDWIYLLKYDCENGDIYSKMSFNLMKNKADSFISNEEAYQKKVAYCKREDLGQVVNIILPNNNGSFSTPVDIFSPNSNKQISSFIISLYSHKPLLLQKSHFNEHDPTSLSPKMPLPLFVFNDGKDEAIRIDEIYQKMEHYEEKSGRKGVGELEIRYVLTSLEQALFLPITKEIGRLYSKYNYSSSARRNEEDRFTILNLIELLRKEYIAVKQTCGENPYGHSFLTESLPNATDFYKNYMGSDRENGLISDHSHYMENFLLIEYSIQERKVKLRRQSNLP